MVERRRMQTLNSLPDALPVFPLPGALLLPGGQMPLNIFEPRYLNMIEDALGNGRLIGMIQPEQNQDGLIPDGTALYAVGCAGRITQFAETDDGRYIISLDGLIRFRIAEELPAVDGYRRVRPDFSAFADDLARVDDGESLVDRDGLLQAMSSYFDAKGITADVGAIKDAPDAVLITSLAMSCPLDPREKQALLECQTIGERGRLLTRIFSFAAFERGHPANDLRQ